MEPSKINNIPSKEEFIEKGKGVYEKKIKPIEKEKNGMYVAIEVVSEEFFIGKSSEEAVAEAKKKHPEALLYISRIGAPASISLRSSLSSSTLIIFPDEL